MSFAASRPIKQNGEKLGGKKKPKDMNRGFKLADDGRLIIEEPKRGFGNGAHLDSDGEDDDDDKLPGESAKRTIADSDSDDDDEVTENAKAQKRKRKASGALSMASGQTGISRKYVAGGRGIHRPLTATASVRSGYSQVSKATTKAPSTAYGSEYRSKKAHGDIKRKNTVDPYAYIPLSRTTLNKRKVAKSSGQFRSVVSGARKGAAAGSKRNKMTH